MSQVIYHWSLCPFLTFIAYSVFNLRRYQYKGGRFDSRRRPLKCLLSQCFRLQYAPEAVSVSNTNEYQEYFLGGKGGRCLGLTTLPPSCTDCLEMWEPQTPGSLRGYSGFALPVPVYFSTSRWPLLISYQLFVVNVQAEQLSSFWRNFFNSIYVLWQKISKLTNTQSIFHS